MCVNIASQYYKNSLQINPLPLHALFMNPSCNVPAQCRKMNIIESTGHMPLMWIYYLERTVNTFRILTMLASTEPLILAFII